MLAKIPLPLWRKSEDISIFKEFYPMTLSEKEEHAKIKTKNENNVKADDGNTGYGLQCDREDWVETHSQVSRLLVGIFISVLTWVVEEE